MAAGIHKRPPPRKSQKNEWLIAVVDIRSANSQKRLLKRPIQQTSKEEHTPKPFGLRTAGNYREAEICQTCAK